MGQLAGRIGDLLLFAFCSRETGHVGQCDDRNIESIAELDEVSCLIGAAGRQYCVKFLALSCFRVIDDASVCDYACCDAVEADQSGDHFLCVIFFGLDHDAVVSDHGQDQSGIGLAGIHTGRGAVQVVHTFFGRIIFIIGREEFYERTDPGQDLFFRADSVDHACCCFDGSGRCIILVLIVARNRVGGIHEQLGVLCHKGKISNSRKK